MPMLSSEMSSASTSITDNNEDVTVFDYVVDVDVDLNGRYRTAHDRVVLDGAEAPEYSVHYEFEDSSASSRAEVTPAFRSSCWASARSFAACLAAACTGPCFFSAPGIPPPRGSIR